MSCLKCNKEVALYCMRCTAELMAAHKEESPSTDVQQLKAEIAALASELDSIQVNEGDIANFVDVINRMRQLSAI